MTDDLLGTVKGILDFYRNSQNMQGCSVLPLGTLRALVARVEQAEAEVERLREAYATLAADASDSNQAATEAESALAALRQRHEAAQRVVAEQAEDEGLWCLAVHVMEADLQAALRRLHAAVEGEHE